MILKLSVVGGPALPTIFPVRYAEQSGALAGRRRQRAPLRLCLPPPLFLPFRPTFLPLTTAAPVSCPSDFPPSLLHFFLFLFPAVPLCHGKQTLTLSEDPSTRRLLGGTRAASQTRPSLKTNPTDGPAPGSLSLPLRSPALWYRIASRPASEF